METEQQYMARAKRNSNRWLAAAIVSAGGIIAGIMVPDLQIPVMIGVVGFFGYTVFTVEK